MRYPNNNILLFIGIPDAFAIALEFAAKHLNKKEYQSLLEKMLKMEEYIKHCHYDLPASFYTDDTEMSIANAKVLVSESE